MLCNQRAEKIFTNKQWNKKQCGKYHPSQHLCPCCFCLNKRAKLGFLLLKTCLWGQDSIQLSSWWPLPAPHCQQSLSAVRSWFPLRKDLFYGMGGSALSSGLPVLRDSVLKSQYCDSWKGWSAHVPLSCLLCHWCKIIWSKNSVR